MKVKTLTIIVMTLSMLLNACSPFIITHSSGEQPTPAESYDLPTTVYQPVTVDNTPVEAIAEHSLIAIEHVGFQAGVGSPIPVDIVASGTWPDLCSQIASVESNINGFNIDITVLSSTVQNCHPDNLGLPFRFSIPLNIVEMEPGTYTITVNGISNTFDLPLSQ